MHTFISNEASCIRASLKHLLAAYMQTCTYAAHACCHQASAPVCMYEVLRVGHVAYLYTWICAHSWYMQRMFKSYTLYCAVYIHTYIHIYIYTHTHTHIFTYRCCRYTYTQTNVYIHTNNACLKHILAATRGHTISDAPPGVSMTQ